MRASVLALLAALALAAPANGATIAVTTTADVPPPGCDAQHCSLRQALAVAAPGDVISVPPSAPPYALRADLGELVITQGGVHVVGTDARQTVVAGGGSARVLAVAAGVRGVTVSGLTIMGGAAAASPRGGGIYVGQGAQLTLSDAAVVANSAGAGALGGYGGGIYNEGTLALERALVAGNLAGGTGIAFGQGGGIYNAGALRAADVTIDHNTAGGALALSGGGGVYTAASGASHLTNATITANRAALIGSGANLYSAGAPVELRDAVVAGGLGAPSCGGGVTSRGHNLEDRDGCGLGGPRDPRLGPLQDNGGQTDTRLPAADSPAVDAGADCSPADQRGFPRLDGVCDIGAAERGARPAVAGFPPPTRNATVDIAPVAGRVRYRLPKAKRLVALVAAQQVPLGTVIDTTRGVVAMAAARDDAGTIDRAVFFDGTFEVTQKGDGRGRSVTVLTLTGDELSDCAAQPRATAARSRRRHKRRLWGSGKGRFRTQGRYSSATVRGTKWLTEDTCGGTLTRVRKGVVDVEDAATHKHVRVHAGSSYVAHPYRCASRRRFHISVPVPQKLHVRRATAVVGDRRVRLRRERHRVTGVIDLRGLPRATFTVHVTIELAGGGALRDTRLYRTCRPR